MHESTGAPHWSAPHVEGVQQLPLVPHACVALHGESPPSGSEQSKVVPVHGSTYVPEH